LRDKIHFAAALLELQCKAPGFGSWFRDRCNEAGLSHCSAHDLRKACATRFANAGCTPEQIKAITGHKTLSARSRVTQWQRTKSAMPSKPSQIFCCQKVNKRVQLLRPVGQKLKITLPNQIQFQKMARLDDLVSNEIIDVLIQWNDTLHRSSFEKTPMPPCP
jgi:Phage integrase family